MEKVAVAKDVALKLSAMEAAIDDAIAKAGELMVGLAAARRELRLSAVVGQEVVEHLSATLAGLAVARREAVATHEALAGVQAQVGLRRLDFSIDMMGPLDKPPPPTGLAEDQEALQRSSRSPSGVL